jgi:hypothetical protein
LLNVFNFDDPLKCNSWRKKNQCFLFNGSHLQLYYHLIKLSSLDHRGKANDTRRSASNIQYSIPYWQKHNSSSATNANWPRILWINSSQTYSNNCRFINSLKGQAQTDKICRMITINLSKYLIIWSTLEWREMTIRLNGKKM